MPQKSKMNKSGRWILVILGALFAVAGLFFMTGGATLVARGGSWYYLICGLAIFPLSWGLFRDRPYVLPLYTVIFAATIVWSLWESGLDFWPLFARLFIFVVAGCVLAFAIPPLRRNAGLEPKTGAFSIVGIVLGAVALAAFSNTYKVRLIQNAAAPTGKVAVTTTTEQKNWDNYGSNPGGERFTALDQINRDNVRNLDVAWTYRTGDIPISPGGLGSEDLQTPLQISNTVYLCTPQNNVIAVDATTGAEKWKTIIDSKNKSWARCRGLTYFDATGEQPNSAQAGLLKRENSQAAAAGGAAAGPGSCSRRIFVNTLEAKLIAVNADTGAFCADFGNNGTVDLTVGMGSIPRERFKQTSAPTLAGDIVVVGSFVDDNLNVDMPSGVIGGFDVRTGALRWAWDSGNPKVTGLPTEDTPYTRGSPNVWAPMSYDPETDTLFLPIGNNSPDLYGGLRTPERDKYASSIVALNAANGRVVWSYQTVHHDLWDCGKPLHVGSRKTENHAYSPFARRDDPHGGDAAAGPRDIASIPRRRAGGGSC